MRIAVIAPADIAVRRFLPALSGMKDAEFAGVGTDPQRSGQKEKAYSLTQQYGGRVFDSYEEAVLTPEADAVYIPLPPALHYRWTMKALQAGKHVLVEKPSGISLQESASMVSLAREKKLCLQENYMFRYHRQIRAIDDLLSSGEIGDIRLYRISFGFPRRKADDFRYDKEMGGGALLDAGGYVLHYADHLLGEDARVVYACLNREGPEGIDLYGSAAMVSPDGRTAQLSFGMDNEYRCELEVWGSKGILTTGRVLTAPAGFVPTARIVRGGKEKIISLPADDAFARSIEAFIRGASDPALQEKNALSIVRLAGLADSVRSKSSST